MTIAELFAQRRDRAAREAAVRVYDEAETTLRGFAEAHLRDQPLKARIESQRAYIAHRAAVAEHTDPPERAKWTLVCCAWCAVYRSLPEAAKPPHPTEALS